MKSKKTGRKPPNQNPTGTQRSAKPFLIVGVGASAGGLEAFSLLLRHLPADTGMGFVLVQHLDPQHESVLASLLARTTSLTVVEAKHQTPVEPNHVYVIPPNTNMCIAKGVLQLQPREAGRGPHLAINFFLQSLAHDQQERAIGIVLSGTGTDGTLGLLAIKAEGGIAFAQDESAKYDSMPRSAVAAGCVDRVLSPEDIAGELARIASHPFAVHAFGKDLHTQPEKDREDAQSAGPDAPLPSGGSGTPSDGAEKARAEADAYGERALLDDGGFKKILLLLRSHSGVDFLLYKSSTIQRRVARRVMLNKLESLQAYADFLRGNDAELDALYSDVLISVTSFFRNPESFEMLKKKVFPRLAAQGKNDPVRVWVLGCSTGQEAYSIAMAFLEYTEHEKNAPKAQVFATDVNDKLLEKARHGLYAKTLNLEISPERLRRFFIEEDGGYRISKALREMCVFAKQNLIVDPPFSRMDLISCRNMLIYLDQSVQRKGNSNLSLCSQAHRLSVSRPIRVPGAVRGPFRTCR